MVHKTVDKLSGGFSSILDHVLIVEMISVIVLHRRAQSPYPTLQKLFFYIICTVFVTHNTDLYKQIFTIDILSISIVLSYRIIVE